MYSKIVQSEHFKPLIQHSDWLFFEYEYKNHTQKFYDGEVWYLMKAKFIIFTNLMAF